MKILPVSFNKQNINNNLNFEAKYANIKQIKDLPCACCGKPVLEASRVFAAYKSVARPLLENLKKINFSWFERNIPKAVELLKNFAAEQPKSNVDEILEDKEKLQLLTEVIKEHYMTPEALAEVKDDPYGKKRLSYKVSDEMREIQSRGRSVLKSSSVVMKRFAPMKKYLYGRDYEIFEQFEIYAQKYPKLRLSEIVQLDEVYKFHRAKDILQRGETNEILNFHIENIEKLVLKANPESEEKLYELKNKVREIISEETDMDARRPLIKDAYRQALQEFGCEKLQDKVFDEIDKFPLTFFTKDSKIVRFKEREYSDVAILDALFAPIEASEDHSIALVSGGRDNIYNMTIMHRSCNTQKGSRSTEEHLAYHPLSPYYTQQQMDRIGAEIIAGNLPEEYDYYPMRASENLRECSNGKIDINVDNYCEKRLKKNYKENLSISQKKKEINDEIIDIEETIKQLQEEAESLKLEKTELNRTAKANKKLYEEIKRFQGN